MEKSTDDTHTFCASSYCFRDIIFLPVYLKKLVTVRKYHSRKHHSMENVLIYEGLLHIFALAFTVSETLTITIYYLQKYVKVTEHNFGCNKSRSSSLSTIFAVIKAGQGH